MKSNIIFLLATVALLLISSNFSKATTSTTNYHIEVSNVSNPEEMAKKLTERMRAELDLSNKQTLEVGTINLKYAKKMEVLKSQGRSRKTYKAFKSMNNDKNAEMKNILTEKQYRAYENIMEEQMKNRRKGGRN